jgi:hypothetical protein
MTVRQSSTGLALVLVLATAPRVLWYQSHPPVLTPDGASYLNVAREWRGERLPAGGWDDRAQLPWDNQAARTPGYPLLLNLLFAAAHHSPTPTPALLALQQTRTSEVPSQPREHNLQHLARDENVRVVQAAQHGLGVIAAGLSYLILAAWTGSLGSSVVGALLAVAWNPVWIAVFEPSVRTEITAGVLLLAIVWLLTWPERSLLREQLAAAGCGLIVIVRPAMVFAIVPILGYLVWRRRNERLRVLNPLIVPAVLIALLIANNGLRYRFWGIASVDAINVLSHAAEHPEALSAPLRPLASRIRGDRYAGQTVLKALMVEQHASFHDAYDTIRWAAVAYVLAHPYWYAGSVVHAFAEFLSPPLRIFPGDANLVRQHAPFVWNALSACLSMLLLSGVLTAFLPMPAMARLAPVIYLSCAVGAAMTAHTQNMRYAVPVNPLMLMSGVTAGQWIWQRVASKPADAPIRASVG